MATFHDRIRELYEQARDRDYKTGREKFAQQCEITRGQVNGYLNRESEPSTEILKIIAANQKVSVSWLVGETDFRQLEVSNITKNMPKPAIEELYTLLDYLKFKYKYE